MSDKGDSFTLHDGDKFTLLMDKYPFVVLFKKATKAKKAKESKVDNLSAKKKSAESEEEEKEPNEYDLNDPFIDNKSARNALLNDDSTDDDQKPVKEDLDEVIKEGKRFMAVESARQKRKHDEEGSSDDIGVTEDGIPICKYGANCYRKNPQHLEGYYHPPSTSTSTKKLKTESSSQENTNNASNTSSSASSSDPSVKEIKELFKDLDESVIVKALKDHGGDVSKTVEHLLEQ